MFYCANMCPVKGSYVLLLSLNAEAEIVVGRLGPFLLAPGLYAYCGSGLAGVDARIARHKRREKKLHWHIDYLLQRVDLVGVWIFRSEQRLECTLAAILANLPDASIPVPRFGSSDCRCRSHLISLGKLAPECETPDEPPENPSAMVEIISGCFASASLSFECEGER